MPTALRKRATFALILTAGLAALTVAGPTTAPLKKPSDSAAAADFIDNFLAGNDDALTAHAAPRLKAALDKLPLADLRQKTVGAKNVMVGADKTLATVVRRVIGGDGKTYEISASVENGQLAGFFVRIATD